MQQLNPAGMVGFDDEDAAADVPRVGVGGDIDAGQLLPAGKKTVVLVGAVDLAVVEVGFEDFANTPGAFAGAPAELGPVGYGIGAVVVYRPESVSRSVCLLSSCPLFGSIRLPPSKLPCRLW